MNNQPHYFSNKMLKILSSVFVVSFFICPAFSMGMEMKMEMEDDEEGQDTLYRIAPPPYHAAGRQGSSTSRTSIVHRSSSSGPSVVRNSHFHFHDTETDRAKRMISSSLIRSLGGSSYEPIDNKNLRMFYIDFPYRDQEDFCKIAGYLFQDSGSSPNLERTDLMLDVYSGRHGIPLMRITAIRYLRPMQKDPVRNFLGGSLFPLDEENRSALSINEEDKDKDFEDLINLANGTFEGIGTRKIVQKTHSGFEVRGAIISNAKMLRAFPDPAIASHKIKDFIKKDDIKTTISSYYAGKVHSTLNIEDSSNTYKGCAYRFQLNRSNDLEVTGYVYTPSVIEYSSASYTSSTIPVLDLKRSRSLTRTNAQLMELSNSFREKSVELGQAAITTAQGTDSVTLDEGFFDSIFNVLYGKAIDGFRGDIYQAGDEGYGKAIKQYATSSYPKKYIEEHMAPFMVAYPRDTKDIITAIKYAKDMRKHIVARSGGHHYTGKSSGGQDTIVLSMDNFQEIKPLDKFNNVIPTTLFNNITDDNRDKLERIEVGPGVRLMVLSRQLKIWGVTIPHGECPQVAIGGHAQTGGYGHLLRSFGLALDYVESFDIVLANEPCRKVTIKKPNNPSTEDERLHQGIFRGVLGGNAGSFGIITKYVFNCIKDSDHTNSYGFKLRREYNDDVFRNLMKEAQRWTKEIEQNVQAFPGLDFMMTIESHPLGYSFPSVLLVELVHSDLDNRTPYTDQLKTIIDTATQDFNPICPLSSKEEKTGKLSEISDLFVRRGSAITPDGREFKYPYKKRINCTTKSLTDSFVNELAHKIDEVNQIDGVYLVFQMLFGGGAYRTNGDREVQGIKITSIPHRNLVYGFVFDLFYEPRFEEVAIGLQKKMQVIVDDHFHTGDKERRVFWGTFGDTDISKPEIRAMYYDSTEQYEEMQALKKQVDPEDIFHTELTVQLP